MAKGQLMAAKSTTTSPMLQSTLLPLLTTRLAEPEEDTDLAYASTKMQIVK
jgi:hypothetical protein